MALTPEAKALLARTIRGTQQSAEGSLRERLCTGIADAAEGHYRLGVSMRDARLDDERRRKRERLEAWLDERARASGADARAELVAARDRAFRDGVKLAGATFLNRIVLLRQLEAFKLQVPAVVTGVWQSSGYKAFRDFAPSLCDDESGGYAALLALVFDELAVDLPGVFGDVGVTRLLPVPPAVLREVLERLDQSGLASAWDDPTTLGWVYQYWNDPDREALDGKLAKGGKIEPHEIASKTQMFTERYMVEWLLQNSLGLLWLAICKKNGWTADAQRVLPALEARRVDWRAKRERGEVPADALMPVHGELEERWKWFVPQPLPDDAVAYAPESIRDVKLLDPACGSGHFLVIAFDLLAGLYLEEARHRGETVSERTIAERILEENLFGIDIDPRAVQIAAASVYLRGRTFAPDARPRRVNLVAPQLQLADLPANDPALQRLKREVKEETGIPEALTERIVKALAGVDHLGTLLKVDAAVDEALREHEVGVARGEQLALDGSAGTLGPAPSGAASVPLRADGEGDEARANAKSTLLGKLEVFLSHHAGEEDLGLRVDGEQLAAGVRFIRMAKEGTYDVVVGNPPYQGTSRLASAGYVANHYPKGKADLYTSFLERALELAKPGGFSALLTMRGWMFLSQFEGIRVQLLRSFDLRSVGDVDRGAFEDVPNEVLTCAMSVFRRASPASDVSVAVQPTPSGDLSYDRQRTNRKRAALLAQVGRHEFTTQAFNEIDGSPLVYWWERSFLRRYVEAPKLSAVAPGREGLGTRDDVRFIRRWHEVARARLAVCAFSEPLPPPLAHWVPNVKGGEDRAWYEPLMFVVNWGMQGLEVKVWIDEYRKRAPGQYIRNERFYFQRGVAFAAIGNRFSGRHHRFRSVFGAMGPSVFGDRTDELLVLLNRRESRFILESLNPGMHFQTGDINRLPVFPVSDAADIFRTVDTAFTAHESAREPSVEFKRPGSSPWRYAQAWAQRAVDRPAGEPLPPYEPEYELPCPIDFVSYAVGIALGRFGPNGERVVDETRRSALPRGILYVSTTERDTLSDPACSPLHAAWAEHGSTVGGGDDLRTWLRKKFFAHHKSVYENRPIYFPLSSANKSFIAWVSIHRWTSATLHDLLAEHLEPEQRALAGELTDLREARARGGAGRGRAETRYARVQQLKEELDAFVAMVRACAGEGPPPAEDDEPRRGRDAKYEMDLDDGVMVNAAGLWPLLAPQWAAPKKWWHELATADGRKDYDWAHLAARYFPRRVADKCEKDPSLAVAHGCFWRLHPAKAYA
jgi:Eco57I restriction-modification methylase